MNGLLGVAAPLGIAVLLSRDRAAIRLRVVAAAFALQLAIALFVLQVPAGRWLVQELGYGVQALLGFSRYGVDMIAGDLAGPTVHNSILLYVLPTIIFFSALVSVLYHIGLMQLIVRSLGGAIARVVGTGREEAMFAAANIFLGQTEAPLTIRPYIAALTPSQIFALMTIGMAGIAGTVLAAYAQLGIRLDYLLAASFMSAPGGLLMAKIIYPDTPNDGSDAPVAAQAAIEAGANGRKENIIEAAAEGAQTGARIAFGVAAMLLAFVALIALVNALITAVGARVGVQNLTVQAILGHVIAPVMYLLNMSWDEAVQLGGLFAEKLVLNEFVAYLDFKKIQPGLSPHVGAVATFSLCGFANFGSIAVQLALLGGLAPEKRALVAQLGWRALAAASLVNLLNAAIAGLLIA